MLFNARLGEEREDEDDEDQSVGMGSWEGMVGRSGDVDVDVESDMDMDIGMAPSRGFDPTVIDLDGRPNRVGSGIAVRISFPGSSTTKVRHNN